MASTSALRTFTLRREPLATQWLWSPHHRRVTDRKYDDPVKITGTIEDPSGAHERVDVEGATYDQARRALDAKVPEGHKLIVIRTN